MKSIRLFLVAVLLASTTLILFLSALHGYRLSMAEAQRLFDDRLSASAHLLLASDPQLDGRGTRVVEARYTAFQIWKDHQLLLRSANTSPTVPISPFQEGYAEKNFANYRWRTFAFFDPQGDRWIFTAERTDVRFSLAEGIILKSVVPVVLVIPASGVLIWFIISFGMRPLRRLSAQLRDKRIDDLSPLAIEDQPIELLHVVRSTNDLLRRLGASFEQQRRFTADAAHELRTPVSVLNIHLHNLMQANQQDKLAEHHRILCQLDAASHRLCHLIDQLLLLYRTAPDQFFDRLESLELYPLVQTVIIDMYEHFAQSGVSLGLEGEGGHISGDRFALETLIKNLLSNACKYTPRKGQVTVRVAPLANGVQLQVEDSGPGVPEALHRRLFDRFYRVPSDRNGDDIPGCGLGLAIVRHIVDLHHGEIALSRSSFDSGLCVTVIFPLSTDDAEQGR